MPYFRFTMTLYVHSNLQGKTVLLIEEPNEENGWVQVPVYALRKWLDPKKKMFRYPNGSEEIAAEAMRNNVDVQDNWKYLKYVKIRFLHDNYLLLSNHSYFFALPVHYSLCHYFRSTFSCATMGKKTQIFIWL